jgi:hypothetical protein
MQAAPQQAEERIEFMYIDKAALVITGAVAGCLLVAITHYMGRKARPRKSAR